MHYKFIIKYLVLLAIIFYPIFGHLESIPIRLFDESRLAMNAYEMNRDGDFIVTHYQGEPDMWNTKPPLMIWIQVLLMKIFGVGEFAIRLPSAIAALFTCIFLVFVSVQYLKDFWFGFISSIVLVTSVGYMNIHAVRTGDYDSLLTLFTTLYPLLFFIYIETGKLKYLYLTFVAIILAALTKGIAGMLYLPVLFIYALMQRKVFELVRNRHLYLGIGLFVFFVIGYYFLREHYNPGYLKAVKENEIGGRYLNTIENHRQGFWFYYRMLVDHHLTYWYLLVLCGVIAGFFQKERIYRMLAIYSTILVVFYFLIISIAQTKLEWYLVPMYPFLAIIIAMFIHFMYKFICNSNFLINLLKINVLPYVFLLIIFIHPLSDTINRTIESKLFSWDEDFYRIDYYLKDAIKGKIDLNGYTLVNQGYCAHNNFYINILRDKGVNVNLVYDWMNFKVNDKIIVYQQKVKDYIVQNYYVDTIKRDYNVNFYNIKGRLNHD